MSNEQEQDDWFEITNIWLEVDPRPKTKKLKLCADASVPRSFVEALKDLYKIPVITAIESNIVTHEDNSILAWSKRNKRVLLTMDRDFWDDKKFPLQNIPGVIFIDVPPSDVDDGLEAFALIYRTLAISFPLDRWPNKKARVTPSKYLLKMRTQEGHLLQYEIKLVAGKLLTRELHDPFN
ncbi:MAG TPA: DUF5615 family PIN-like protein [Candidatus Brocadiales bacterium]|nr:DUF5615 family PIN-like protein [Candidatus Brocadiales bacterium]